MLTASFAHRATATLTAATVTVAALAACGSASTVRTGTAPASTAARERALPRLSAAQASGLHPMAGTLLGVVDGGSRAEIRLEYGGCSGPPLGAVVADAPSSVTVTPYDQVSGGQVCAAFVANADVMVDLPSPLGSRTLSVG